MAGVLIGSYNFLIEYSVKQIDSYRVFCLTGFGMLFYFTLYHLTQAFALYRKKGYLWSKADSHYYQELVSLSGKESDKNYELNWKMIRLISLRFLCSIFANIAVLFAFRTAIISGVNTSIIFSLLSATSITTAVLFYFVYNEKLKR